MTKKLCTLLMTLTLLCQGAGAQIIFQKLSWEEAKAKARQEQKAIFVDVYTSWCGPCKKMARDVFPLPTVGDHFNQHFICLQLDAEKEKDHGFFAKFTPQAYPSFYWTDADGQLMGTQTGYMEAEAFVQKARDVEKQSLSATLESCRKEWEAGNRDSTFVQEYLFKVLPQVRAADVRPLLCEYLQGLSEEEKASPRVCGMVTAFSRDIRNDEVFRTLARNSEAYRLQKKDDPSFDGLLYTIFVRVPLANRQLGKDFAKDVETMRQVEFPARERYLTAIDVEQQLFDGKYADGLKQALALTEKERETFPCLASELAYTLIISDFFTQDRPQEEAAMALQLAEAAMEATPSKSTLAEVAACHALMGNHKKAYELMMNAPFMPDPMLSRAVFPKLNISKK